MESINKVAMRYAPCGMRWIAGILGALLIMATSAHAALELTPPDRESLDGFLESLVEDHDTLSWCVENCAIINKLTLTGKIKDGRLLLRVEGAVIGDKPALIPLWSASPDLAPLALKNFGADILPAFTNKTYHVVLPPGPFALTGEVSVSPVRGANVTLPLPVGEITLDIEDQEPALKATPGGQVGGSFQIVSARSESVTTGKPQSASLRRDITRSFTVARDKNFSYVVAVSGARPGQIISVALEHGEKVLEVVPITGKIHADRVDFTAASADETFALSGEWTKAEIALMAPAGAIRETWEAVCEGANDCTFAGEVEKVLDPYRHRWAPLPGQTLTITWGELGLLAGQSIVAQRAILTTERKGDGLSQTLNMTLTSSASDSLLVGLPPAAIPVSLAYDGGSPSPVLKNASGQVHLTIPRGDSAVDLAWEIPARKGFAFPMPEVKLPVGTWAHLLKTNPFETVLIAGGKGAPVVLFWPRLAFCLFLGLLFLIAERRVLGVSFTLIPFWLVLCAGFALTSPETILIIMVFLALNRWLKRVNEPRTAIAWFVETGAVLASTVAAVLSAVFLMDTAFFTTTPFTFESFCSYGVQNAFADYYNPCWEISLTDPALVPAPPYAIVIPVMAVRVAYFLWALMVGYFFFREGRELVAGLRAYFGLGRKPLFKPRGGAAF